MRPVLGRQSQTGTKALVSKTYWLSKSKIRTTRSRISKIAKVTFRIIRNLRQLLLVINTSNVKIERSARRFWRKLESLLHFWDQCQSMLIAFGVRISDGRSGVREFPKLLKIISAQHARVDIYKITHLRIDIMSIFRCGDTADVLWKKRWIRTTWSRRPIKKNHSLIVCLGRRRLGKSTLSASTRLNNVLLLPARSRQRKKKSKQKIAYFRYTFPYWDVPREKNKSPVFRFRTNPFCTIRMNRGPVWTTFHLCFMCSYLNLYLTQFLNQSFCRGA